MIVFHKREPLSGFFKKIHEKSRNLTDYRWTFTLLFICIAVLEFFRRPDALLYAQPFSEDGPIFLDQAIYHSVNSIFIPYAGYFLTVPRIVSLVALQFGIADAPLVMNFFALFISSFCIAYIYRPQFRFLIPDDFHRFILAIFIVCIPNQEIFLNITNIQWFLILYLTLWSLNFLFHRDLPKWTYYTFLEIIFTILAFLSCPISAILVPGLSIGILFKIYEKNFHLDFNSLQFIFPLIALYGYCLICAIQHASRQFILLPLINVVHMTVSQLVIRFFWYNAHNFIYFYSYILTLFIGILLAYSIFKRQQYTLDCWIISLIFLEIVLMVLFRPDVVSYLASIVYAGGGEHYFFYPMALLLILFFRHLSTFDKSKIKYLFYIILFALFVNFSANYELTPFENYQYPTLVHGFDEKGSSEYFIPINPRSAYMEIPSNPEFIQENLKNGQMIIINSTYIYSSNLTIWPWEKRFRYDLWEEQNT
jgi:hypothetical protein